MALPGWPCRRGLISRSDIARLQLQLYGSCCLHSFRSPLFVMARFSEDELRARALPNHGRQQLHRKLAIAWMARVLHEIVVGRKVGDDRKVVAVPAAARSSPNVKLTIPPILCACP